MPSRYSPPYGMPRSVDPHILVAFEEVGLVEIYCTSVYMDGTSDRLARVSRGLSRRRFEEIVRAVRVEVAAEWRW